MGVMALIWTLVILFGIIFAILYILKGTVSNETTMKVQKNSKSTKDDDWWRKELGIHDSEKISKKIMVQKNYSQVENENDITDTDGLVGKIRRLKTLYNNGALTKAEFEKAKNKLLR